MHDPDLTSLLKSCTNDELDPLVGYLINRISSSLPSTAAYQWHQPNHQLYVDEIVDELQRFGGNSFVNAWRGHGIYYSEVLDDVCSQVSAPVAGCTTLEDKEIQLLMKILHASMAQMTPQQLAHLQQMFQQAGISNASLSATMPLAVLSAQLGVRMAGFVAYQLGAIVANAVAQQVLRRGLTLGANAALTRGLAVLVGPIGLIITALWAAIDLAGPAFRVTIPACCHIAFLRQAKKYQTIS